MVLGMVGRRRLVVSLVCSSPVFSSLLWLAVSGCLPYFVQHPYAATVGEMENSKFGNLVTPSLQGEVDFFYWFSDLVKESLFDAATCFSALLAALVLVLPSHMWHYTICFQPVSMLSAAFVAFPGFLFPGCENIFEYNPKAGLGCSKFLREVDDKFGNFLPFQVRDAGIQAFASVAAISGFHNVFVCGCAAAALASAFAYLFTLVVGISAAAACVYECTLVLEGTSVLFRFFAFGVDVSAAAAFSDVVTFIGLWECVPVGSCVLHCPCYSSCSFCACPAPQSFAGSVTVVDVGCSGTSVACLL